MPEPKYRTEAVFVNVPYVVKEHIRNRAEEEHQTISAWVLGAIKMRIESEVKGRAGS